MASSNGLQKTLDTICQAAVEVMTGLIDTRNMYIAMYDEPAAMIKFELVREDSPIKNPELYKPRPLGTRNGLTEWIIRNKQSLLIEKEFDAWAASRADVEVFKGVTKCWLGAPMIYQDKVIGVIGLQNFEREGVFDAQHKALLETIASQAAVAIENARLNEERERRLELERERAELERERAREQERVAEERRQRLVRLQEISERMAEASLSPDSVLELVAGAARELSHSDMASIYLFDSTLERFTRGVQTQPDGSVVEVAEDMLPSQGGFPAQIVRSQSAKFIEDVAHHPEATDFAKKRNISAFAGLPLSVGRVEGVRSVVGLLFVNLYNPHSFSTEQKEILLHLANQAAIAIDYASARKSAQAGEQLAALGTAAATLQHRLGNTINVILPAVLRLRFRLDNDPENKEILDAIERNALFATEVIRRMQTPLREEPFVETDFNALLRDAIKKCMAEKGRFPDALITTNLPDIQPSRPVLGKVTSRIKILADLGKDLPFSNAKIGQLTEVFRVLVENGIKAIYPRAGEPAKDGQVTIKSRLRGDRSRLSVEIVVTDTGKGMDNSTKERLFTQPVPRKEFGEGAGLGLWLSNIIVRSHEGSIELVSTTVGVGSTFKLVLPILSRTPAGPTAPGGAEGDK